MEASSFSLVQPSLLWKSACRLCKGNMHHVQSNMCTAAAMGQIAACALSMRWLCAVVRCCWSRSPAHDLQWASVSACAECPSLRAVRPESACRGRAVCVCRAPMKRG